MTRGTSRRDVLKLIGGGAAAAAGVALAPSVAGGAAVVALNRRKPEPLPPVEAGSILSAKAWNDVVARVNELSEAK